MNTRKAIRINLFILNILNRNDIKRPSKLINYLLANYILDNYELSDFEKVYLKNVKL